ncbi:hypothetical protein O6H91_04G088400 [Diphasiastrum complanatum]|uniref:Uncharacterized protein n=1 Tax=Diphasiastrum complanatum TaxID=34168 RepID=A0ACC2DZ77_DIPCM|nr:hypothetical protein O6H91_04G088400 [Diphasiastrum complanatum]
MSLVCFPFKEEDVSVVVRNIECAASHPSIAGVLCVGFSKGETWHAIESAKSAIEQSTGKSVILLQQRRIGTSLRGGKGDGMNTALVYFLDNTEYHRLHFYDADIVSFSASWISKAEKQADLDYDVVRHYFPRSSTDAMITWLVTKIGFALLWPNSILPAIEQPLGGELLVSRKAAEILIADQRVRDQSDWGIDTLYTFVMAQAGLRMAEVYVPEGKVHALYGGLQDLRTMLVECFAAIQSLRNEVIVTESRYRIENPRPVPEAVKQKIGYNIEKTLKLLKSNWSPRQKELLQEYFDPALANGMLHAIDWPCWSFADEEAWISAYQKFLDHFEKGDFDWEELLFKIWVARVLNHTMKNVIRGYDAALGALRDLIWETQHNAAIQLKASSEAPASNSAHAIASGHTATEGLSNGHQSGKSLKNANWSNIGAACTVQH